MCKFPLCKLSDPVLHTLDFNSVRPSDSQAPIAHEIGLSC